MIYKSDRITYCPVMMVSNGPVNDILICRDGDTNRSSFYTLIVFKDHETVKKLIRILETSRYGYDSCLDFFQYQNRYCMAFSEVKERKLTDFYMATQLSLDVCTEICENLVLQCMLSKLPYPLLYLVLRQEQIHLLKDYNIELGYTLDFSELDETIGEKECADACAFLVRELLQKKKNKRNIGYSLLSKKLPREDYQDLQTLYRDLKVTGKAGKKQDLHTRLKLWRDGRHGTFFRVMLIICIILVVFTLICLISKAIFGDVPFLRIFYNHFKTIGTESLVS